MVSQHLAKQSQTIRNAQFNVEQLKELVHSKPQLDN